MRSVALPVALPNVADAGVYEPSSTDAGADEGCLNDSGLLECERQNRHSEPPGPKGRHR